MDITVAVDGTEYVVTIEYTMGEVGRIDGGTEWGVEDWNVTHVDGVKQDYDGCREMERLMDEETVMLAIKEWEA